MDRLIPISYVPTLSQGLMRYIPPTDYHPRSHYRLDKARSLVLLCQQIKNQQINFFRFDYKSPESPGLIYDFLGLAEEKHESFQGRDVYRVVRKSGRTDDFAHAVNYAACAIWYQQGKWPAASLSKYTPFSGSENEPEVRQIYREEDL